MEITFNKKLTREARMICCDLSEFITDPTVVSQISVQERQELESAARVLDWISRSKIWNLSGRKRG